MTPFEQFYASYPRREARKDAEKAWKAVNGDKYIDAILAALQWQVPEYLSRERHYRPLPATYLRGERWTDENPNVVSVLVRTVQTEQETQRAAAMKAAADRQNAINEARERVWREREGV